MSSIIKILPDHVVNKIAAGEVVERPSSVVKEMIENSLDAGATDIVIDIEQAGRRLIRITDNGSGMEKDDAQNAFLRHATSKITTDADLDEIRTMGFRGEALSSIASVSHIRMITACGTSSTGVLLEIEGGTGMTVSEAAAPRGTSIEISHLFYNTPARLKFLKSAGTEFSHILTAVSRQAMAHSAVRFKLAHNKKLVLDLPVSQGLRERVFQLYGGDIEKNLVEIHGDRGVVRVHGLVGRPAYTRADRTYQDFYVNHRAVRNASLTHALYGAYGGMLMRDRHPIGFVFIEADPALVDVNVHPAKTEVRFRNQSQIHDLVWEVIREGLRTLDRPADVPASESAAAVREAVAGYVEGRSSSGFTPEPRYASPWFGRRKADVTPAADRNAPAQAAFRETGGAGVTRDSTVFGQDLFPLAQIHDSFIIAQSKEGMSLIDQHAAHERVLFEKLQDQYEHGMLQIQNLLIPVQVELGLSEGELLSEYLPELEKLGLLVEPFGSGSFIIKGVPALLAGTDYTKLLLDILEEVRIHGKSGRFDALRDELFSVMACHPAIKVNRHLEIKEMEALLRDLFLCRMPHTCPHGRPTIIRFTMDEIRKLFKRL